MLPETDISGLFNFVESYSNEQMAECKEIIIRIKSTIIIKHKINLTIDKTNKAQ